MTRLAAYGGRKPQLPSAAQALAPESGPQAKVDERPVNCRSHDPVQASSHQCSLEPALPTAPRCPAGFFGPCGDAFASIPGESSCRTETATGSWQETSRKAAVWRKTSSSWAQIRAFRAFWRN